MGGKNRIVVDYGDKEALVLLGAIETKTNKDVSLNTINYFKSLSLPYIEVVRKYNGISDYSQLKNMVDDNHEGFVIHFKTGLRMKIKGEEYCRLHKLASNLNKKYVWECLSTGNEIDLNNVPDEWDEWLATTIKQIRYEYMSIQEHAGKLFDNIYESYNSELPDKKKYSELVFQHPKHLQAIMFKMYDRKPYDSIIWKLIKPKNSKVGNLDS